MRYQANTLFEDILSESETEERKVIEPNQLEPATPASTAAPAVPVRETVYRDTTVPERREEKISRRKTNAGAIVAIAVGVIVLIGGIYLVLTVARVAPAPYSYIIAFVVGIILIAVGAKFITTRT
jgi:cytochrome c biogenesis protein CcdA